MALKGVKVIEFGGLAPGPFCGMILADFGASVLRVDKIRGNTSIDCLGNGKHSIALNLKNTQGKSILQSLCKKSDVLIEPFRRGIMEDLGLGPDILLKDNPRLIYARLTGYGQSGCYSKKAGHDINYIALSGVLSHFGRHNEKPSFPVNLVADFGGGGLMCALGIILALYERNSSGLGQVIDNNMVEGSAYLGSWLCRSKILPIWGQERGKNVLDGGAHFYEIYKTKDGKYMSVGAIEPQFYDQLIKGLNLTDDEVPQFMDFEEGKEIFAKKFLEKTQEEWCEIFDNLDACVTPVLSFDEAAKFKHNLQRESFVETSQGFVPKPGPKLSRTPAVSCSTLKAPERGEHTRAILKGLNYSEEEIAKMERDGVIECYNQSKL